MIKACYYLFGIKLPLIINYLLPVLLLYPFISKFSRIKLVKYLIILFMPTVIFIKNILNNQFFLSDDFAHLVLSRDFSYLGIAERAFSNIGIWVNHHIVVGFWMYKGIFDLWGGNPIPYITAVYLLHLINIVLFNKFLNKLKITPFAVLFSTLLFSFQYLSWFSNIHELLGTLFVLLSLNFWTMFINGNSCKYLVLTSIAFVVALLSKEITFLTIFAYGAVTYVYNQQIKNKINKKTIFGLIVLCVIALSYWLLIGSSFLGYSRRDSTDGYKIGMNIDSIVSNLEYYARYYFPLVNAKITLIVLPILFAITDIYKRRFSLLSFAIVFMASLLPVLLFENRNSDYYALIPSIYLFTTIGVLISGFKGKRIANLIKTPLVKRIIKPIIIVVVFISIFGLTNILLKNCFLIFQPWENHFKNSIIQVSERVSKSNLQIGERIELTQVELTDDLVEIYSYDVLDIFVGKTGLKYIYNPTEKTLLVVERRICTR